MLTRLPHVLLAVWVAAAAAHEPAPSYPLWDGRESVASYAQRAGLSPTRTIDLGDGVGMEFVLVPAGRFSMGTPEPETPAIGMGLLVCGLLTALALAGVAIRKSRRQRRRLQYSLRSLIAFVLAIGLAQYGGFRFWKAIETIRDMYDHCDQEMPAHEVTIGTPFYMGKCEVTTRQYQRVMGERGWSGQDPNLPVDSLSWDDAEEFCRRVNRATGLPVRLPSEAEWEYACRAGTSTRYYTGDSQADLDRAAWHRHNSGHPNPKPVGQKAPNNFGLYDMLGNVWEWVADDWHDNYTGAPANGMAWIDGPRAEMRVRRGGASSVDWPGCIFGWRSCWGMTWPLNYDYPDCTCGSRRAGTVHDEYPSRIGCRLVLPVCAVRR